VLAGRTLEAAQHQDQMNWLNRLVVCSDCNRPTLDSIKAAGVTLTRLEHTTPHKAPSQSSIRILAPPLATRHSPIGSAAWARAESENVAAQMATNRRMMSPKNVPCPNV
jgi:hypothetical protein